MLAAEEYAGQETDFACPVCGHEVHLASRSLGQEKVNVLECPLCAGLWLGHGAFDQLRDRVKTQGVQPGEATVPQSKPQPAREQKGPRYRACVHCGKLMQRRAYGQGSGVIIDTCRHHGIWFDAEELQHILAWILKGGKEKKSLARPEEAKQVSKEPIFGPPMGPGDSTIGDGSPFDFGFSDHDRPDLLTALVREVAEGLFGLFKR
jgi:Zn-finger nucleic acid-binding protein